MAGERDLGLQALQNGDIDGAVGLLVTACGADPTDYQAHIYLGAAYSQAQRATDAIHILTKAVELQPSNPQARYNLATAMERGGHSEQAIAVFEQALTLQPDYPKASEALQRLRTGAPLPGTPGLPPGQQAVHTTAPQYSGGAPDFGMQSPTASPPSGAPAPVYGAPLPGPQPNSLYGPPFAGAQSAAPQPAPLYGAPPPAAPYPPQQAQPYSPPGGPGLANYGAPSVQSSGLPPLPNAYGNPSTSKPPTIYSPQTASADSGPGALGIFLGLVLGGIAGIIGLVLWVAIRYYTGVQIGYAAIGVGALIGWMTKLGMRGGGAAPGIVAAIISFFSLGLGCFLTGLGSGTHIVFSILFLVIGVSAAYRIGASG